MPDRGTTIAHLLDHYLERLWREPRSTGRTALNVVRFAENEPEGE